MIVARSFSPPSSSFLNEKNDLADPRNRSPPRRRSKSRSPQLSTTSPKHVPTPSLLVTRSEPVKIPTRHNKNAQRLDASRTAHIAVQSKGGVDLRSQGERVRKESAQDILLATAIPARRRPKGRPSQRLPQGDYVADFSKILLADVQPDKDGSLGRNQSWPHADGLFGNIDELVEGQFVIGSEGAELDETTLSARSISSDSLASLASPEDFSPNNHECQASVGRSVPGRHALRLTHSEDCTGNHPLADLEHPDSSSASHAELTESSVPPSRNASPSPRPSKKEPIRSSFKSTLTSSLKALGSAARTTLLSSGGFGQHAGAISSALYSDEAVLAHNFFDIQPSLTDDRRPPPTMNKPSPQLRRYLNPQMASAPPDSPTQLHFWQDERQTFDAKNETKIIKDKIKQKQKRKRSPAPKSKIDALPSVVALATCLPPTVRTANASSPPIWLTPDGQPVNKNTSNALAKSESLPSTGSGVSKNREPRENRDFLRMFVCEMAMRRSGKLNDDLSAGRAKLWLPPLSGFQSTTNGVPAARKTGAERWKSWTAEDLRK